MTNAKISPYGSWKSPITSELIVREAVGLSQVQFDDNDIYWVELRPSESGRQVVVRHSPDGDVTDVTPTQFIARTRVHEYGGGDYDVNGGTVYFSNFSDQKLYRQSRNSHPESIVKASNQNTGNDDDIRYADAIFDKTRNRLVCVREDHTDRNREAVNNLAAISLSTGETRVLAAGNDIYSSPRINTDGSKLAWLTWNHPNMPWDGCELWVAEISSDGSLANNQQVAGSLDESIFQPEWAPDGILHFVSDQSGWSNIYRANSDGSIECVCEMDAEFGLPQWIFGMSTYAFETAGRIVCTYSEKGIWHLGVIDAKSRKLEKIDTEYSDISFLRAKPGHAVFRAGAPAQSYAIIELDLRTRQSKILRRANNIQIDAGYISEPQAIEFPTEEGKTAYGFFYPPGNRDFVAPENERPPLLVKSHGGPTAATAAAFSPSIQYWTSRGIGVLDVNYGGSTGYGRRYRERLNDKWGIVDVDDSVNGALHLVAQGRADNERLMIDGGSAGGYTTLCALTFREVFHAGASHFGVSDAEALAKETHKFESRYLDRLIGPYPERRDLYFERSPINFTDRLSCPVIFFQGLEDKVVPPNQAEVMVEALRKKGLPVAYVAFAGEQHGFRKAENIRRSLDGELYFYSQVFGFELAEEVEPVEIENLN